MAQLALAHDSLLPRSAGGQGPGAALSMVVHVGLIAALTTSIDWRTQTPEVFSAEIWASVPQTAAPAPMEAPPPAPAPAPLQRTAPPPPLPDADIAIERERQRKAEVAQRELDVRKKAEAERKLAEAERKRLAGLAAEKKQAEQQEREGKADDERLAKQREENLKRMMGQAGGTGTAAAGTGTAAQSAGPSATYAGKVIAAVRPNIKFPGDVPGNATTEVEVRAAAGGSIISSRIVKKSGHEDWDTAVLRAIDRTGSLPRDSDGRVPTTIVIVFRRE